MKEKNNIIRWFDVAAQNGKMHDPHSLVHILPRLALTILFPFHEDAYGFESIEERPYACTANELRAIFFGSDTYSYQQDETPQQVYNLMDDPNMFNLILTFYGRNSLAGTDAEIYHLMINQIDLATEYSDDSLETESVEFLSESYDGYNDPAKPLPGAGQLTAENEYQITYENGRSVTYEEVGSISLYELIRGYMLKIYPPGQDSLDHIRTIKI